MHTRVFPYARLVCSSRPQIPFISYHILTDPHHVLHPVVKRRFPDGFKNQRADGLWVVISVRLEKGTKLVIRNWVKRRFAEAFFGELRSRGYTNIKGKFVGPQHESTKRHVEGASPEAFRGRNAVRELRGHADIALTEKMAECKGPDIQLQASNIVDEVIKQCGIKI